jgi:3-hydroxybutyrate dehydrogenase
LKLKGKRALITGSTSGIGLGIAQALAAEGADIMVNGFEPQSVVEKIAADLAKTHKVKTAGLSADLTRETATQQLIAEAEKRLGPIDILVNNAGIQFVAPVEEFPLDKWDQILALNLTAAFHAIRLVFAGMKSRGFGRIINIASAHGLVASPFKSAYVAAKHGVVGFTKVVAIEGAANNVTCNAICPGYVHTPLVDKQIDDQAKAHGIPRERVISEVILEPQPMKRFTTIEEVAGLAVFLCGPSASTVTGTALSMDGGWTAH